MRESRDIRERLRDGEVLVIDGAIATELIGRGVPIHDDRWSLIANVDSPDAVRELHRDYIAAGADVISANTFGAGLVDMRAGGLADRFEEINRAGVRAAIDARVEAGADVSVAGVISCPCYAGSQLGTYGAYADVLAEAGADIVAVEMIGTVADATEAIAAVQANELPVWAGISARRDSDRGLVSEVLNGPAEDIRAVIAAAAAMGVDLIAVMHTEIADLPEVLELVRSEFDGPIGAYPHRGTWAPPVWSSEPITPAAFAALASDWVDAGVQLVGGCCGIGPDHIAAVADMVRGRSATVR